MYVSRATRDRFHLAPGKSESREGENGETEWENIQSLLNHQLRSELVLAVITTPSEVIQSPYLSTSTDQYWLESSSYAQDSADRLTLTPGLRVRRVAL